MAFTFKRKNKAAPPNVVVGGETAVDSAKTTSFMGLRGTKPWKGGATVTSTGLQDLDGMMGGGQPLGTCMLVEEDRWTNSLATAFVRYWCAEAVSQDQTIFAPSLINDGDNNHNSKKDNTTNIFMADEKDNLVNGSLNSELLHLRQTLPRNLHWDKQQQRVKQEQDAQTSWAMSTLVDTPEGIDEEGDEEQELSPSVSLDQNKDNQQPKSSPNPHTFLTDNYCHSYDLSGQMSAQMEGLGAGNLENNFLLTDIKIPFDEENSRSGSLRAYQKLLQHLQDLMASKPRKVIRLLLYHIDPQMLSIILPLLLAQIRLHGMPVVVLVCVQPWNLTATKTRVVIRRTADVVLQTEGFSGRSHYPPPSELRHLHGLMMPRKVSCTTAATAIGGGHYGNLTLGKRPPSNILGIKRDRRKLHTLLLHIPPQEQPDEGSGAHQSNVPY